MKFALIDLARSIATVQAAPFVLSQPDHPLKSDPKAGVAVSVTAVPTTYDSEQSVPHEMPVGFDVTVPLPSSVLVTLTVSA